MPKSHFSKGRIAGMVTVIPPHKKSLDDELELYGNDRAQIERLKKIIGLNERHVADEKTTAADLCECAANSLLKDLHVNRAEIDGLIMVTQTPDYFQPSTAAYLHGALNLAENCAAFDVNLGCSGYVYGLWLAFMMVEAGSCEKVLLLAGDTMSKCVNPNDKSVAALFGDAGSATLIETHEVGSEAYFSLHTDGKGFRHIMIPAGAFRMPRDSTTSVSASDGNGNIRSLENLCMNSAEVFNFAIKVEPAAINEILELANKTEKDIDYIIFQQSNKYLVNNVVRRLKFPLEKAPCTNVGKYANQSSASIPAAICDSQHIRVSDGIKDVILSGFGVGLSWASCLVRLDNIHVRITGLNETSPACR